MNRAILLAVAALLAMPAQAQTPPSGPRPPDLAAVVTASEIEGVRNKIRPCWSPPAAATRA